VLAAAARAKSIDRFRVRLVGSEARLADLERRLPDDLLGWSLERRDVALAKPDRIEPATDGSAWADAIVAMALETAAGFQDRGFPLDLTVQTLPALERVLDRRFVFDSSKSPFSPQGLRGTTGYVGEVIRQAGGGQWIGPPSPLAMDYGLANQLSDGSRIWPRQRIAKRLASYGKPEDVLPGAASPFQEAVRAVIRPTCMRPAGSSACTPMPPAWVSRSVDLSLSWNCGGP